MNVNLKLLSAGALFFLGGVETFAQKSKKDTLQTKNIDEVEIVVAYGKQTKESLTGSVASIKAKELKEITSANVVQGMAGKVAGVQIAAENGLPGTSPTVRFRGIGSINGSSAPLYVVDGVPFTGSVSAINNQDIESMSFLKDAAATSLYGNRGANGVIIITTKKGKRGGTVYTLDSKSGVSMRGIQEYNISDSPSEYYEYYYNILKNQAMHIGKENAATAHQTALNGLITGSQGLGYNITNVANADLIGADGRFNPAAKILYKENWADYLFRKGFYTNTFFSAAGSTDNTSFYYSAGYESNDTYMVNSKWEKITTRVKADSRIGSRIKLGTNLSYSFTAQNAPDGFDGGVSYSNPFSWSRSIAPIYPLHAYTADGQRIYRANGDVAYDDGTGTIAPFVRRYASMQNPYATALHDIKLRKVNQIFASGYGTFNILKGLDFTYKITGEFYNQRANSLDTQLYGDAVGVQGRLRNWNNSYASLNNQQLLEYSNKFGNLSITALVGHETYKSNGDYLRTDAINAFLPGSVYSDMYATMESIKNYGTPYGLESWFSRLNLEYGGKYFLSGSVRRDGSSRFHPDNRWGNFYSFGGSWIVSKEKFFENDVVNHFKLKASYGEVGNDNLGSDYPFPYLDLYEVVQTAATTNSISYNQVFKGNPEISWEKNKNLNAGVELGFFNNRVTVDAEYFRRRTNDLLFMKPLPMSQGFKQMPWNIGSMENRGVELSLGVDIVRNSNFSWNINGNATWLKNEILSLPQKEMIIGGYILKEGNSRYNFRLREFAGVDKATGAALFVVEDPTTKERTTTTDYSKASLLDIGKSAIPKVYGGFGTSINYNQIDFNINFAYQFGGWAYDNNWMSLMGSGLGENFHRDYYKTWTPNNTDAELPIMVVDDPNQYYGQSTLGLIKSDYISLQNVSLGYTFDPEMINFAGINSLRLYVLADNVYVWSKRKGYDPRMSYTGASDNTFSPIRTISFGLNVTF